MTAKKIKAAEDGWKQNFRLRKTPTGDLKGTESLYAEPTKAEEAQPDSLWPDRQTCKDILAEIDKAWKAGKSWSPKHQARITIGTSILGGTVFTTVFPRPARSS
jgi:hypothetical protein